MFACNMNACTQIWQAAFPRWKAEMRKRLTAITWPLTSRPLSRSSGQLRTTCPRDPDQKPPQRPLRNCPSPVKSPLNWSGSTSLKNRKESTHVNHAYKPSLYHRCPLLFRSLCVLLDHLTILTLFRKTTKISIACVHYYVSLNYYFIAFHPRLILLCCLQNTNPKIRQYWIVSQPYPSTKILFTCFISLYTYMY